MKEKVLKILITLCGMISIFLIAVVHMEKIPDFLMDKEMVEDYTRLLSGDLYYLCSVENFHSTLPEYRIYNSLNDSNEIPEDTDMLIFGDSFFKNSRGMKTLPELLSDSLNKKIYFESGGRPLKSLVSNYKKGKRKILLLEIVERAVEGNFARPHTLLDNKKAMFTDFRNKMLPESKEVSYQALLSKGILMGRIYSSVITFKFNAFGLISDATPVYSRNPDWLFYFTDVTGKSGFYYNFKDEEIDNTADNILTLKNELSENFNLELVLLVLPNKYTLYHRFANNDNYNNYIPRLYKALEKRNIATVNVYDDFKNSEEILYYPTDTHWNEKGAIIALNKILSKIRGYEFH